MKVGETWEIVKWNGISWPAIGYRAVITEFGYDEGTKIDIVWTIDDDRNVVTWPWKWFIEHCAKVYE